MSRIVNGKQYNTLDSKCIAQGLHQRIFTPPVFSWMFKTNKNNFFLVSMWASNNPANPSLYPVAAELAFQLFQLLPFQDVTYSEAFPDEQVVDA